MNIFRLAGDWQFKQTGSEEWLPGRAPGGVHTDLLANGRIPDPFAGDNEKRVAWVAETDWTYRRTFTTTAALMAEEQISLVCDGLDTLATVLLNGQTLGSTDNMFRQYRWEVKRLLRAGENEVEIRFASPVKYVLAKQAERPLMGVPQAIAGGPHLRKAPCQFGWDWGPQLPPVGIWKDIRLEGYTTARLGDVHLRQEHDGGRVKVVVQARVEQWGEAELSLLVRLFDPDGRMVETSAPVKEAEAFVSLEVNDPKLWWPNGYGEQPLYRVEVALLGPHKLDEREFTLGLRTMELRQEPDEWGRSFEFVVNGVSIFAKGSNWIPADTFPTRISDEQLERLIRAAAETHQNMLRVWGGGLYEEERFYDLCDRYGILVWQDFLFACSIYPLDDPAFVENVRIEVVENVRRLRHRASLALWCGNNEMEWAWVAWLGPAWDVVGMKEHRQAYDRFYHHLLPEWVKEEDPDRAYWPSSPSSDTPFEDPNGQAQGDAHYWDVWHGRQPFTAYRGQYPRFMSEFGFQALPPLATIQTYAEKRDWNMTSYIMEQHQKNASGNALMVAQMLDTFRLPKDFEALVYLSLALQAEGIRYGVEHWRRHPQRVKGILYWQLNDCWPVASWSSVDYFGRWKALHYAARRFFAPVMLSIEDRPPVQAVYVTNETLAQWEGIVRWRLETLDGKQAAGGEAPVSAGPQSAVMVGELKFGEYVTDDTARRLTFVAELWQGGQMVSRQMAFFAPVKHLELEAPGISTEVKVEGDRLKAALTAHSAALAVELTLEEVDVVFSDNYFHLPAGVTYEVTAPLPSGWTVEQAKSNLKIRSVYESYEHGE